MFDLKKKLIRSCWDRNDHGFVAVMAQYLPTSVYAHAQIICETREEILQNSTHTDLLCKETPAIIYAQDEASRARNIKAFALIRRAMEEQLARFQTDEEDAVVLASPNLSNNMRTVYQYQAWSKQVMRDLIVLYDSKSLPVSSGPPKAPPSQ
jgi:hypothetical protein